jgi:hypothetical protein
MSRPNRRLLLDTISIGRYASESTVVDNYSIAIGRKAGQAEMGDYAIAIGEHAGEVNQGIGSIAIGRRAGKTNQFERSIVLSTSESEIVTTNKGLYIDPIRKLDIQGNTGVVDGNILSYSHSTKEITLGFPRLPAYQSDSDVISIFVSAGFPLGDNDVGTMYLNTVTKTVKVWMGNEFAALATSNAVTKKIKDTVIGIYGIDTPKIEALE